MKFFESFYSLGYSGIVLLVTVLFITALLFNTLAMHKRHWSLKSGLFIIMSVLFVLATNFLADERKIMMDAIRDEGGLKRTQER